MVNSVGKKLQQARLSQQLSVEEAARVTRIRPDKIIDLEEDNYSNFPSMSYAKGFLTLYARFLGVDVREFAETLHAPNPVSSEDYEYLNVAAHLPPTTPTRRPYDPEPRRQRAILPVVVFAILICVVGAAIYLVVSFERLGNLNELGEKKDQSSPAGSPAISTLPTAEEAATPAPAPPVAVVAPPALPAASAIPVARAVAVPVAVETAVPVARAVPVASAVPVAPVMRTTEPVLVAAPAEAIPPVPTPPIAEAETPVPAESPPPAPAGTFDPTKEVRRAEPVVPSSPAPPDNAAVTPQDAPVAGGSPAIAEGEPAAAVAPEETPEAIKEVSILPIRKTMVTVRKDVADSAPIFQDWLYPGDGPLKLSGHKFWIQVQDPSAVQITQDGQALPSGQGDISIE
ncbi:MAG: helix-turn-helix domain-containing protein [Chthoniobacteraceae bacterium]|jgi:cytoskeletal protein RodZ